MTINEALTEVASAQQIEKKVITNHGVLNEAFHYARPVRSPAACASTSARSPCS